MKPKKKADRTNFSLRLSADLMARIDAMVVSRIYRSRSDAVERLLAQAIQRQAVEAAMNREGVI